ncbi:unnamed protein product [Protopolystoma xenopodis]|uniref:Uncharacterized protein n=1 Tax=Protopolystoma xenopodis TaxID=117903 RepID=A0A3S5BBY0_9PLAT|nr:unnamed protein product [Protopolystoma xenopodis]
MKERKSDPSGDLPIRRVSNANYLIAYRHKIVRELIHLKSGLICPECHARYLIQFGCVGVANTTALLPFMDQIPSEERGGGAAITGPKLLIFGIRV